MSRSFFCVAATLIATMLTTACANQGAVGDQDGADKIVNGQAESGHPYVVSLIHASGQSGCTGSLISSQVVLTAAHCIEEGRNGYHPPMMIEFGSTVGVPTNTRIPVRAELMRPGWKTSSGGYDHNEDIALLFLASPASVSPLRLSSLDPQSLVGRPMLAVGYGVNNGFQQSGGGIKRSVEITIRDVSAKYFIASWTGDTPRDTCQGDSGGPATFQGSSGFETLGVVSNGPEFCQGNTQYTSVFAHRAWIDANMSGANATPVNSNTTFGEITKTTCAEVKACVDACQTHTPNSPEWVRCMTPCQEESSQTALSHYISYSQCAERFMCRDGDTACLNTWCADQLALCGIEVTPTNPVATINTCVELGQCVDECESAADGGACAQRCYQGVSDNAAINLYNTMDSCLGQARGYCNGDRDCIIENCADEIRACGYRVETDGPTGDPMPTPRDQDLSCYEGYFCLTQCSEQSCYEACYARVYSDDQPALAQLVECYNESSCNGIGDNLCLYEQCPDTYLNCTGG